MAAAGNSTVLIFIRLKGRTDTTDQIKIDSMDKETLKQCQIFENRDREKKKTNVKCSGNESKKKQREKH